MKGALDKFAQIKRKSSSALPSAAAQDGLGGELKGVGDLAIE
ncbi:MAG: hypothetical protein WKG07_19140 [Hymenobacter sp.]